ncbi:Mitochondrial Translation Optimization [Sparganum proliferum]
MNDARPSSITTMKLESMQRILFVWALSAFLGLHALDGLNQTQRDYILNFHRQVRDAVNATDMKNLTYDLKLEHHAQKWVNNCKFISPNATNPEYKDIGQNIGAQLGPERYVNHYIHVILSNWAFEKTRYTHLTNRCRPPCVHYKQMVWANTTRIGCALQRCAGISVGYDSTFMACEYNNKGDVEKQQPYTAYPRKEEEDDDEE